MDNIIFYEVEQSGDFASNVRRLTKKKRFNNLPDQIISLDEQLVKGIFPGALIKHSNEPEPYDVYKLRLPNPDTNVGKSNGYRIIYIVVTERRIIVLLTIYYKKEDETVTDTYIEGLIDGYFLDAVPYDDETGNGSAVE
jgi:mRNA-degrading endonuclease RelE of RelBE toxin-antitoxin system